MTVIIFLLILTALVFVHELGHFAVAKFFKIRVDEFAIGFPPKLLSKKVGETLYSINLLPLGGFVKIFGENPDDESINGADKERSFVHKRRDKQALVLVAGVVMNILFAFFLFTGSYLFGVARETEDAVAGRLVIVSVIPDSPAEMAELRSGDQIVYLETDTKKLEAPSAETVREFISSAGDKVITLDIKRAGKEEQVKLRSREGLAGAPRAIGIQMSLVEDSRLPFLSAVKEGAVMTALVTKETAVGIYKFFARIFTFSADLSSVSGPVGIAGLVGEARQFGIGYLLSFAAMISVNLAVINLFPFPALDGGRLLFVLIETIRRKAISPKVQNAFNIAGFVFLMALMVLVTVGDIKKLF